MKCNKLNFCVFEPDLDGSSVLRTSSEKKGKGKWIVSR